MAKKFTSRHPKHSPDWLRDLRQHLGGDKALSLRAVAGAVGASHVAWSYWEKGKPIKACHKLLLDMLAAGKIQVAK
jgi:hypothetical protein